MDLKSGTIRLEQRKPGFWGQQTSWIALIAFLVIMLILVSLVVILLIRPSDQLADSCDNFSAEESYCLTKSASDLQRTYSTRTTLNQSLILNPSLTDKANVPSTCSPVMFYLFSRHSIRYPKRQDIIDMAEILPKIQSELSIAYNSRLTELCDQDYSAIKQWSLKMVPDDDNHVTPSGVKATKAVAKELYSRYPNLFDPDNVKLQLGITSKVRTNETAHAFMEGLKEAQPAINYQESDFIERPALEFHSICKKKIGFKLPKAKVVKEISASGLFKKLRERVSKRMGLTRTISDDELDIIYKSCGFEQAIYESAPWCALFTQKELKILEFREDIGHYYKNGPGLELNAKMACVLIRDLYESIEKTISNPDEKTTYLYFSHAGAITRLWDALNVFDQLKLKEDFCPSGDREWKTSLILPFNVNFQVILYRCSSNQLSTNANDYQLLTMMNGLPFEIDKCNKPTCKASEFLKQYKELTSHCDLDEICKPLKGVEGKPLKSDDDDD